ncbi:sensor histidine kinase [Actinomadura verrucosospora]|uniref:histidine kinase n=1 Tax=Actinomadura verrucosospora TaxID=46165 RepID=A0A7D4AC87_ACTVE|nr:sensor histidine kinase [Actinomadura verrucosospora]QKG27545.1 two-component system sensor kinase [Actinomadura verrucosospora]
MNEPHRSDAARRGRLLAGATSAVVPGRDDPAVTLLPGRRLLRMPLLALLLAMTIGFTAGSIAISIQGYHVDPGAAVPLGVLMASPMIFAARWPLAAWRIAAIGLLVTVFVRHGDGFMPWPVTSILALVVILFFAGVGCERETTVGVGAVTIVGVLLPAVLFGMPGWFGMILAGITAVVLTFGDAVGGRRSAEQELRRREEQHRQDLARQAVLEERARIARELHDVVAHHMSVIAMQAEAAPFKIPDLPDAARETFGVVRDAAREALTETRRVVGLLRSDDEGAERAPSPGLDRLDELAAAARNSGLSVATVVVGMPRQLDAGVDLSAYRIVQESLSNAARYAPGSRVHVEIKYGAEALAVTVDDDGARGAPDRSQGGGHGLVGMRERVTMLGGALSAGPRGTGGWTVAAELPYGD